MRLEKMHWYEHRSGDKLFGLCSVRARGATVASNLGVNDRFFKKQASLSGRLTTLE